ncbi:hypothetical protein Gogos_020101 [Gossypium gossypioides]|uniref:Phytocyanin domain-containing protein n=1 Tax=Gossypium gossypioides TaxID=34282 RepID=A0A7J9CWK6_GOSGO|nr:hypothetical protein [Gossypium gossypioides]
MGFRFAQGLVLLQAIACVVEVSLANKGWDSHTYPYNHSSAPKRFTVGGSQHWQFGVNYTDWSLKTAPFYFNDTLVFKYDPPSNTTFPHSVSLLPNLRSFLNCDLKKAKLIANQTQGGGNGFEFVLKKKNKKKPYYFVCGERNGFHCKVGIMKFAVAPLLRPGPF